MELEQADAALTDHATESGATVVPNTVVLESIVRARQTPQGESTPEQP